MDFSITQNKIENERNVRKKQLLLIGITYFVFRTFLPQYEVKSFHIG